jgi:uncharacterized protein
MEAEWGAILASPVITGFNQRKMEYNSSCGSCPHVLLCHGDCPKNRRVGSVDGGLKSWLCAGWHRFYAHALPHLQDLALQVKAARGDE